MTRSQEFIKRLFDVLISAFALLAVAPVMVVLALLVKLTSKGPALYKQTRLGKDGKLFSIYKLRTMTDGAPYIQFSDGSSLTAKSDPRVTKVGRVLRALSLDELPQLLNVFIGDMSLVGPRPDQLEQAAFYTPYETRKLGAKPGITGLAMIRGRNSIPWKKRIEFDIEYVNTYSLRMDAYIFLRTIPLVILRQGIHSPIQASEVQLAVIRNPSLVQEELSEPVETRSEAMLN